MYRNILIPISFKVDREIVRPLKIAETLAGPDAKITLLHVIEHLPPHAAAHMPHDYLKNLKKRRQLDLDVLSADLPSASGVVIEGHSGRSILDWANRNTPDLIVLASHRPDLQDAIWGSTSLQVVKHAICSVHLVR